MLPWYESAMREATPLSGRGDPGAVSPGHANRRPIRLRDARWLQVTASFLARLGVRPNQICFASMLAREVVFDSQAAHPGSRAIFPLMASVPATILSSTASSAQNFSRTS